MSHVIIPTDAVPVITAEEIDKLIEEHYICKEQRCDGVANSLSVPRVLFHSVFEENGFLSAVHASFHHHIPLKIAPDDIWMVFLSQFAAKVNEDPEKYRDSFVSFKDKKLIEIVENSLVLGEHASTATEKWATVFPRFEEKMKELMKLSIQIKFTTTTTDSYIASQMMVMNSMKKFFNYRVTTKCGIPEVHILGTMEDWLLLMGKVQELCNIVDPTWIDRFSPFIQNALLVIQGNGDPDYFAKLYHYQAGRGSGQSNHISGHITKLFPIGDTGRQNRETSSFPPIYGKTEFVWNYYGNILPADFHSGLTDVLFEDGAVRPLAAWKITLKE